MRPESSETRRVSPLQGDERGQMVLLAGVIVTLALAGMLVAVLQLGYHEDVTTSGPDERPVVDAESFLYRATDEVGRDLRDEYTWHQRDATITAVRDRLRPYRRTLERSRVESGVVANATLNATVAQQWASANCPGGDGREFGPCHADDGIVIQERDGRTLVLAVVYDLTVATDRSSANLTVVSETG